MNTLLEKPSIGISLRVRSPNGWLRAVIIGKIYCLEDLVYKVKVQGDNTTVSLPPLAIPGDVAIPLEQ